MAATTVELFSHERLTMLEKRRKRVLAVILVLALAAAAVCALLTSRVNTQNIYRMMTACICISVGTAWVIIYLAVFLVRDAGREIRHARHLEEGERQTVEGRVSVLKLKVRVRNSVTLRKVRVETAEGPEILSVHIDKADQLRRAGEWLRLYTVHGYIVAYEGLGHGNH